MPLVYVFIYLFIVINIYSVLFPSTVKPVLCTIHVILYQ